ncbi:hypothetical protein Golomagni_06983 [Golovinomyces magnicellulatus]|nr:hypothetical protein Golomagni_06983 [Golovinomyces magnicellulatus]
MALDKKSYLAVAELIVYVPALIFAVIVCSRHGFRRASGWVYTLILCVIRTVGSIMQIVAYSKKDASLITTVVILESIGISPLLFATLGMLSRFVDSLHMQDDILFTVKVFRLIQTVITVGMILGIIGGTSATPSADGTFHKPATSKVGVILYCIGFIAISFLFVKAAAARSAAPLGERKTLFGVSAAWPLIAVRLVYSLAGTFTNIHAFSVYGGSVIVRAVMCLLEEFIVVAIYLGLGFVLRKMDVGEHGDLQGREWKATKGRKRIRGQQYRQQNQSQPLSQQWHQPQDQVWPQQQQQRQPRQYQYKHMGY